MPVFDLLQTQWNTFLSLMMEKKRFLIAVTALAKAFALSVPHEEALKIRDELALFQTIRAQFIKHTPSEGRSEEELDIAVRQIVSKAITSDQVMIFSKRLVLISLRFPF